MFLTDTLQTLTKGNHKLNKILGNGGLRKKYLVLVLIIALIILTDMYKQFD